jgi:serine/threonine protein kinase
MSKPMTFSEHNLGVELGRGAEAVVYALRGGTVALKIFRKPSAASAALSHAERHLRHANVVRLIAHDSAAGWLAMDCIRGSSLSEVILRGGALEEKSLVPVLADVLDGLTAFHRHGMPHRDIKPSNVMQDWHSRRCILIDWIGQAAEDHNLTRGKPVGTPVFMAPEVARTPHRHCVKSDSWAIGCTVVNLTSGRLPWAEADAHGRTNDLMAMWHSAHGNAPPHDKSAWTPELQRFVARCFEADPTHRATAMELRAEPLFVYSGQHSCLLDCASRC